MSILDDTKYIAARARLLHNFDMLSLRLTLPDHRESHAHRHAKELILLWLRIEAAAAGYDGLADFCDVSWRVNRPGPHFGVWTEYPVLSNGLGIEPVWDEQNEVWRSRPPTFDEIRERDEYPAVILDIAIQHKGRIAFGIEIAHKHRRGPSKIEFLRDQLTLIEIPAYWVLGQVDRPTSIPSEFFI